MLVIISNSLLLLLALGYSYPLQTFGSMFEIKFVILKNPFYIRNIVSNCDLVYLRKNENLHSKLLNTI